MSYGFFHDLLLDMLGDDRRSMSRAFIAGTGVAKFMYLPLLYFSRTFHFDFTMYKIRFVLE
jgi:hypothetical protein